MRTKIVAVVVPDEVRNLMKIAAEKKHKGNVAQWVRSLIARELRLETINLQERGGRRPGAGRKPAQSAPPRRPVPADGEIKPRSRRAADEGTKKRRSDAA